MASICSVSHATKMDENLTCSIVYGALFEAAKNAQHEGMILYSKLRLQAILPFLQENRDNPKAKEKLKEIVTRLKDEIGYKFVSQTTNAILEEDTVKLKAAMQPVFQCDKAFGLATQPFPLKAN